MKTRVTRSLEKRSASRQIDTNSPATRNPGRASLLRATRLLKIAFILLFASFASVYPVGAEASPSVRFEATSDVGDFLGGGRSRVYTQTDVDFQGPFFDQSTPGRLDYAMFFLGPIGPTFDKNAIIVVSTRQLGYELRRGTYFPVERAAFASPGVAGLDISVDYTGCNTVTGTFTIRDIRWSAPATLAYFDMDFEQHCDGQPPALRGRFAYDATGAPISFAPPAQVPVATVGSISATSMLLLLAALFRLPKDQKGIRALPQKADNRSASTDAPHDKEKTCPTPPPPPAPKSRNPSP